MAQQRAGATDQLHNQTANPSDGSQPGSSTVGANDMQRTNSTMSQSHTLTPSRGGTLKKRQSVSRKNSIKRTGSKKGSRPGSVRSLTLADDVDGHTSEMHSAFFTPVPTSGSPTEILANRFQVWRKVLKDLITYFRDIQKTYEARSKPLYTLSNVISNITAPPEFISEGGISDAYRILRDYHKQSITEGNKAKSIEEDVIVQLTGLRSDLGQKIKEIKSLSGDFKNGVDKETESTRRAVRDLQDALGTSTTDPKNDPYLVRLGVDRQLGRQIEEENYLHRAFLNLESSGRELESIVMGEIQKAYNAYAGIIKREADEAYEAVEKLQTGPLAVSKDYEWNAFVDNNEHFVDPRLPIRRVENITYPGKDAAAASEVKAGMLERKSKYLKSYTPGWYVLSTTHLHEFKSPDRIASQTPVMSLALADQKLGSRSATDSTSHKFMLKGRQSGAMHRGHSWVFRAESYDTMLAWYDDIKNLTEKTGAERNAFIQRSHARSVSAGSHRASSISSDGLEEDEADQVPYSATASQAEMSSQQEKLPQRPTPGGRFPSALSVNNRDSQAALSPSSNESVDESETVAATSALPGNPSHSAQNDGKNPDILNPEKGHRHVDPSVQPQGMTSEGARAVASIQQHENHQSIPRQAQRHDSKYGDWMEPAATGVGRGSLGAGGVEAYRQNQSHKETAMQSQQPGLQGGQSYYPSATPTQRTVAADQDSSMLSTKSPSGPAELSSELLDDEFHSIPASRVDTISDLHLPGEYPKTKAGTDFT